jgi:hypothetical protein
MTKIFEWFQDNLSGDVFFIKVLGDYFNGVVRGSGIAYAITVNNGDD